MTQPQPRPQCPVCHAEGDWLMCGVCSQKLVAQLRALPGLLHELHVTLTRQARMGSGGAGGKGKERPLPFNVNASEVSDEARMTLSTWVRELDFGDTEHLANNPRAWALWLADRIERIRGHEAAEEIADTIDYLTRQIRMAIDRPADQEFYGKCAVCEADLYAPHGSVEGYCRRCKAEGVTTTYDPAANRASIQSQAEHHWGTVAECTRVLAAFGLEVEVKTIRNWATVNRHGNIQLEQRGVNKLGLAVYRIGDVMDLARARAEQGKRRRNVA